MFLRHADNMTSAFRFSRSFLKLCLNDSLLVFLGGKPQEFENKQKKIMPVNHVCFKTFRQNILDREENILYRADRGIYDLGFLLRWCVCAAFVVIWFKSSKLDNWARHTMASYTALQSVMCFQKKKVQSFVAV